MERVEVGILRAAGSSPPLPLTWGLARSPGHPQQLPALRQEAGLLGRYSSLDSGLSIQPTSPPRSQFPTWSPLRTAQPAGQCQLET